VSTNRFWVLAVDFGTTNTVAAVAEAGDRSRVLQVDGTPTMPSSVYLDSEVGLAGAPIWLTGKAAEASALIDAARYEPSPKRAMAAGTVFLAGVSIDVVEPVTAVFRRVFVEASRQHDNTPPAVVLLTHPALWRGARLGRLTTAAQRAAADLPGWPAPQLLAEPVAAARHAAGARHLPAVCRLAVLDLGGGTCDVAVVDRSGERYTVAGPPLGVDPLGGDDFDARLVHAVLDDVGDDQLTRRLTAPESPADRVAALDLRRSVRTAKETLSVAQRAHVRVPAVPGLLPDGSTVQVSREGFERLVAGAEAAPGLDTAAELVASAIVGAPPGPEVAGVFLVGGSARIPLLGRLVAEATQRVPAEHGDPATAVAEGGAAHALDLAGRLHLAPPPETGARSSRRPLVIIGGVLAALLLVGVIVAVAWHYPNLKCSDGTVVSDRSRCAAGPTAPADTPTTVATTAAALVKCWDGSQVYAKSSCSMPTGRYGMAWVFKTIDAASTECGATTPSNPDIAENWECTFTDGTPGRAIFRRWTDVSSAARVYAGGANKGSFDFQTSGGGTTHAGDRWEGTPAAATGWGYVRIYNYDDYPYSIELLGASKAEVDALDQVVLFCSPDQILGRG
jgi:hypothetical protein